MRNSIIISVICLALFACSGPASKDTGSNGFGADTAAYSTAKSTLALDGLLDTIMPHIAKLHDSIPSSQRFHPKNRGYMRVEKLERQYRMIKYAAGAGGYTYFMVKRMEPSIKRDKFATICGRFMRDSSGSMDSASYEELFYTWKMTEDSLAIKSAVLFKAVVEGQSIDQYLPEKSAGFWVEFPSATVWFDKASQTWKAGSKY